MKTQHYKINAMFATKEGIPTSFVAVQVRESARAIYVYGHGVIDPQGSCARCGRTLTHPGSILIGIGPECFGNWTARDIRMDNMSGADKDYLKSLIREQKVDCWIPKSIIKANNPTDEAIQVPADHEMLTNYKRKSDNKTILGKKAREWKGKIAIQFPYAEELVTKIKTLPERKYHSEGKFWTCLIGQDALRDLKEWGFELDPELTKILERSKPVAINMLQAIDVPEFGKKLYGFQKEGIGFLEARNGRALIGDEMGLGKTIQSLAWLQLHPEKRPVIIVCPASLKLNWAKEIKEGMSIACDVGIANGITPHFIPNSIIIINYDILNYWVKILQTYKPQVIIADEAHYFKSNSANRTKAIKKLAKGVPHFIALTGTPIVNRPIEMFNALKIIDDTVMPSYWQYAKRYCGAVHNGFGWDFSGATNTQELHEKLTGTIMIRRKKADVLKDLPDKVRSFVPFALDNQKEYDEVENNFIEYIRATKGDEAAERASNAEVLAQIEALKQIAVKGKMNSVIEWVRNFLDTDGKLVVFATHKMVVNRLMEEFSSVAVKIDGSVSMTDRNAAVERFQNDDSVHLFVGNIRAAGLGLTLTAASNVAFVELPWTPGELVQAEDRLHRIGQENSVTVYYLLTENTIESEIAHLLDGKRKVLDSVLDGEVTEDESLLTELMKKYY